MSIRHHALRIDNLSLPVRLGCLPEERQEPQEVRFTVELRFSKPPVGIESDEIGDTVCYAEIADVLKAHCQSDEFKLIERLAVEAFEKLRTLVGTDVEMGLVLHKVRPPVEGLLGGSVYKCGDFLL